MGIRTGVGALTMCSAWALLAPAALAQVAEPAPPATEPVATAAESAFGDVVVTARRRAENAQDVPVTVAALGSE